MKKFKGFQLIKLVGALNTSGEFSVLINDKEYIGCMYQVEIYNIFGEKSTKYMSLKHIDRDFGKLRMNGGRFAKLQSGNSNPISEETYNNLTGASA